MGPKCKWNLRPLLNSGPFRNICAIIANIYRCALAQNPGLDYRCRLYGSHLNMCAGTDIGIDLYDLFQSNPDNVSRALIQPDTHFTLHFNLQRYTIECNQSNAEWINFVRVADIFFDNSNYMVGLLESRRFAFYCQPAIGGC